MTPYPRASFAVTKKPTARRAASSVALPSDPLWFKDAVLYELHVRSFCDGNGDGVGDFRGLTTKLDYLQDLGVDTLWLLPFYPSPLLDDGYDIADYFAVNPLYGKLADFERFLAAAHARKLRVVTELVVNHTSDRHPWFQRARKAKKGSPERDFYVWSDDQERYKEVRIIFRDFEKSNWTWDAIAKQYYWHRFFSHQPDLNYDNPVVQDAIFGVMDFWMGMGVDGMRLDAVPYLFEREGTSCENLPEGHEFLRKLRKHLDRKHRDKMLLSEACQWPEDTVPYFGKGDECHMNFHFPIMPRLYMALAKEDRSPILDILAQTPAIPEASQWATFLRNHDELTLEMVTEEERVWMWQTYAKDPRAKINLGIRRRLAPLMDGDRKRIELMHALLLTLPGTPVLYYGDEIGMGDDLSLPDRHGLRTPMQWDATPNAGFSKARRKQLVLPPVETLDYHFEAINVAAQLHRPGSLLEAIKALLKVRKASKVFGRGSVRFLEPANPAVLAFVRELGAQKLLLVFNLSGRSQAFALDLRDHAGSTPVELLGKSQWPLVGHQPYGFTLEPHSFFVLDLASDAGTALGVEIDPGAVSPSWLAARRWFGSKEKRLVRVLCEASAQPEHPFQVVGCQYADGTSDRWFVPRSAAEPEIDTAATPAFAKLAYEMIASCHDDGLLKGEATSALRPQDRAKVPAPKPLDGEQSNTSHLFGQRFVLKIVRRFEAGENPDFEVPRFLRERAGFAHVAPTYGALRMACDGKPRARSKTSWATIAILHGYVQNVGDAWRVLLGHLAEIRKSGPSASWKSAIERVEETTPLLQRLGQRIGQMHLALASDKKDKDFAPEPFTPFYQRGLWQSLRNLVRQVWGRAPAGLALPSEDEVLMGFSALRTTTFAAERIRTHGDLHLGQVLVTPDQDCVLIDFEGEPMKALAERKLKRSPLRDVAGVVRSLHYAAAVALREAHADPSSTPASRDGFAGWLEGWRAAAVASFLESWFATVEGSTLVPKLRADADALLDVFVLEKAIYELAYELGHRPTWVGIPVAGIRSILESRA